jgi:monoterpene epsilon-lactone hydrolase
MKSTRLICLLVVAAALGAGSGAALENIRQAPARTLPVPEAVSPAMQAVIGARLAPIWNTHPKSAQEWKEFVQQLADLRVKILPGLREKMGVTVEPTTIGGIKAFIVTPNQIAEANRERILIHFHGGGYVLYPGESGTSEAIMMAGHNRIKVISIDYRMPPDFPYPAAMDDAMAAYREVVKTTSTKKIGVFGTSTGGGMTLALVLRAKSEGLPLPAAIAPGTPWSDMTKTGDTYFANEMVDNVLVSNDGWLGDAANLYANGHDLKDPMLSPVYGDLQGFPPTILTLVDFHLRGGELSYSLIARLHEQGVQREFKPNAVDERRSLFGPIPLTPEISSQGRLALFDAVPFLAFPISWPASVFAS